MPRVLQGGMLVCESTPWARSGLLWSLFEQNFSDPKTAIAARAKTLDLRDDAKTLALVVRERLRDPENAAREFDACFLDAGTSNFFDALQIQEATHLGETIKPEPGATFAGADFAFRGDSSALVICSRDADGLISIVDVTELRPTKQAPLVPSEVVDTFAARCRKFHVHSMLADGHNFDTLKQLLAAHDITIRLGPVSQRAIGESYSAVRDLFAEGRLRLPDNARLRRQLTDCVGKVSPGGALSIQHPRTSGGGHGDLVAALVNGVVQARQGNEDFEAAAFGPRRFDRDPIEAGAWCDTPEEADEERAEREWHSALSDARRFHY
jgi:hypothetical protein